ncbi:hypothetical protein ACFQ9J_21065 [Streptomyces sp. NPDC056529]|uniref:hypothetical protein n=1 Tax=Streptomyces sp. NPDC056529 TaxID=3345855 RepID=UPI00368D8EE4
MVSVDDMREELYLLLARGEEWLRSLAVLSAELGVRPGEFDRDVKDLDGKRNRALSTLLNVGLLGRQSSGKSFLISGLQKGLTYLRLEQADGDFTEKYIGILPSSPLPTTACPSTVTPVAAVSPGSIAPHRLLRVKFVEDPGADWTEIGDDLSPDVVAAYGAADGDLANRREEHRGLTVLETELLIGDAALPVKFYDLPGSESPNPASESIMRNAWGEADCFLYVSQGTATLTAHELGLITDLYNHHLQTGKPVLWVLTGIDRANQLGNDDRPAWWSALETNNTYLREQFHSTGPLFVGEGFFPVSPAWEAQAFLDEAEENHRAAHRNRVNSRMDALRERLLQMVEKGAGHRHLEHIAGETRRLIRRRHSLVTDTLTTHQMSVEQLTGRRDGLRQRLKDTERSAERIQRELQEDLDRHVRSTERLFEGLAEVFHRELDAVIDSGDLGLEHTATIRLRQTHVFTEWMNTAEGAATVWQEHLVELDSRARALVRQELRTEGVAGHLITPEPLDPGDLLTPLDDRRPLGFYGMVQAAAAAVSVAGSMAGGATWLMSSLSLASIAFPVGAVVALGLTASLGAKALRERRSVLEQAREQRKQQLDQQAQDARDDFTRVVGEQGRLLSDAVGTHLAEHRARLRSLLQQTEDRIGAPDMVSSRETVARLEPVDRAGRDLLHALTAFTHYTPAAVNTSEAP